MAASIMTKDGKICHDDFTQIYLSNKHTGVAENQFFFYANLFKTHFDISK